MKVGLPVYLRKIEEEDGDVCDTVSRCCSCGKEFKPSELALFEETTNTQGIAYCLKCVPEIIKSYMKELQDILNKVLKSLKMEDER